MKNNPPEDLQYELYSGAAGEVYASDLLAYLRVQDNCPNPDMVILSPDTAPIPGREDIAFTLCLALADRATEINFEAITKYLNRLPMELTEFSFMTIKQIISTKPKLVNTQAFVQWSIKNAKIAL